MTLTRRQWVLLFVLLVLLFLIWGLVVEFFWPGLIFGPSQLTADAPVALVITVPPPSTPTLVRMPTPLPTRPPSPTSSSVPTFKATALPTAAITLMTGPASLLPSTPRQLPELYVDGPYIKRSDTGLPVWLKGVNVEEFRQPNPHTFSDLYLAQGLSILVEQKWGINLLRVAIDPETVGTVLPELDKLVTFGQENGMYILLAPFASATNPSRSEFRMFVPDDLVATAMGKLAARFKNRTNILYGIWNEPHPDSIPSLGYNQQWQVWMPNGIKVARSIRSSNPKAVLVVPGGTKWARDLTYYLDHPFPFDNVIYDAHDYAAGPDFGYNRGIWMWAIGKYPVLIGEMGGNPINPFDPASITYMRETLQIVDQNPMLVHYAMYVLTADGAWGLFTKSLTRLPKADLFFEDLNKYQATRLY